MTWSDKNTEKLKNLFRSGKSTGEIAAALKITRGAVCAKLQRLGLQRKEPSKLRSFAS